MKITRIETIPVAIPLLRPMNIASGVVPAGNHVVIRVHTDEGLVGLGEASPVASTDADTQRSIVSVIADRIVPRLVGRDARQITFLVDEMDKAVPGHQCAKAGIDIALHDLVATSLGVPVYQLLGGRCRHDTNTQEADIWIDTPEAMALSAGEARRRGVTAFEVKIGTDPKLDIERVRAVRQAIGPDARMRVDCNEGYDSGTALKTLRAMEQFDLDYIEQPLPRWDFRAMACLASALDTPICADQGAYTPHDVFNLLAIGGADLICIKVAKSGLLRASQIHATARSAGVKCTLGSMLPLGIGAAAIQQFALSAPGVDVALSGVYGSALDYFTDDLVTPGSDVGLGVTIDEAKLSRYAVR
jgi:L-alanine-DL-glutamate epimerase-like enolase superfamily enzyme